MKNVCKVLAAVGVVLQLLQMLMKLQENESSPIKWDDVLK